MESTLRQPRARSMTRPRQYLGWLWLVPALAFYGTFVLYPLTQTVRYSLFEWNGIGQATWVGGDNYAAVFTNPDLYGSLLHTVMFLVYFTAIPIALGLIAAELMRSLRAKRLAGFSRVVLFLPQIVPLAAAGIAWRWLYDDNGLFNQILRAIGAGALARPWLADFDTALPAVGIVASWALTGFCTILLLSGVGRIDPSLYEAAALDGASPIQEFFAVTLPGLRHELVVSITVTMIAAIAAFDLVYMMTKGGPGNATMVPGVQIVRLAFTEGRVGLASALSVVLMCIILLVVVPIQRLNRSR